MRAYFSVTWESTLFPILISEIYELWMCPYDPNHKLTVLHSFMNTGPILIATNQIETCYVAMTCPYLTPWKQHIEYPQAELKATLVSCIDCLSIRAGHRSVESMRRTMLAVFGVNKSGSVKRCVISSACTQPIYLPQIKNLTSGTFYNLGRIKQQIMSISVVVSWFCSLRWTEIDPCWI